MSMFPDLILLAGLLTVGTVVYKMLKHLGVCVFWATRDTVWVARNLREGVTFKQALIPLVKMYFKTIYKTHKLRMSGAERTS